MEESHEAEGSSENRDADLQEFHDKILAKCQTYRNAAQKDRTKKANIVGDLENDFGVTAKTELQKTIEAHKMEATCDASSNAE